MGKASKKRTSAEASSAENTDAASPSASASTSTAAAAESVDDIFAALEKPKKAAKKEVKVAAKAAVPARSKKDDALEDDSWRAGAAESGSYYEKQADPKVHRCVAPPRLRFAPPRLASCVVGAARAPSQVHERGPAHLQVLPPRHEAGGREYAAVPLRLRVLFLTMSI